MVTKCFWFDLKFGYLAYASISVSLRTAFILFFYCQLQMALKYNNDADSLALASMIGWNSMSTLFCFFAIAGIIKERSILIYTYIIILISEAIIFDILMIVYSFQLIPYFLFGVFLLTSLYTYDILCLISLYIRIKNKEVEVVYQNVVVEP